MIKKEIKGVIIPRHDTAEKWAEATSFKPAKGELIIYDADTSTYGPISSVDTTGVGFVYESSDKVRIKIGDGVSTVNVLPFVSTGEEGGVTEEWIEDYVRNNANTLLYLDRCSKLGHRIELPDVYPIQTEESEFKIVSRNRFEPANNVTVNGVTVTNVDGVAHLSGTLSGEAYFEVLGTASLPARGDYSIKVFDITPGVDDADGINYNIYLKGYTQNENGEKTYQMYPLMNQTQDVTHIDTRLLGCDYIDVELSVYSSTEVALNRDIKIQIEYGKIEDSEITFTPYKSSFTNVGVHIYKKNLIRQEDLYDNRVNISDTVYLYGILSDGTEEELWNIVTDSYGAYIFYGEILNDYKELRFDVYDGASVNHPLNYSQRFNPPVIKGDKFTFVFRCTSNRMQDDMRNGAIFMLGHIVNPEYEEGFHEAIVSDANGNCDINHINYPYTLAILSEEDYANGYNLFIKWDSALTRSWVEDELDKLDFKIKNLPTGGGGTGTNLTVDTSLSSTSTNPVQNKVIKAELDKKATKTDTLSGYGITDAYTKAEVDSAIENVSVDLSDYIYVGDVIKLEDLQSYIFEEDKVYHFSFSSGLNELVPSGDYLGEYFDDSYDGEFLILKPICYNGKEYEINLDDLTLYTRVILERLYLRDTNNSTSIYSICVTDGKLVLEQHDN